MCTFIARRPPSVAKIQKNIQTPCFRTYSRRGLYDSRDRRTVPRHNMTFDPVNHFSRLLVGPWHPTWPVDHLKPRPRRRHRPGPVKHTNTCCVNACSL